VTAGVVGAVVVGLLIHDAHQQYERYPSAFPSRAVADAFRCNPMTEKPAITQLTLTRYGIDQQVILAAVSDGSAPAADVESSGYGIWYTYAAGADTQQQRDELLRGSARYPVRLPDPVDDYNVALVPILDTPGYREMVVWRDVTTSDWEDSGTANAWYAICGTVGFTVEADGSLSDAHLVENEEAGTFQFGGQLR
jgi:hypothetical protein